MKERIKVFVLIIGLLVSVAVIGVACSNVSDDEAIVDNTPTESNKEKEANPDVTITIEEYEKLKAGMTYNQVVDVVGGDGYAIREVGSKATDSYTVIYQADIKPVETINLTFQDGKLAHKSRWEMTHVAG